MLLVTVTVLLVAVAVLLLLVPVSVTVIFGALLLGALLLFLGGVVGGARDSVVMVRVDALIGGGGRLLVHDHARVHSLRARDVWR